MWKTLIIDDEKPVRIAISKLGKWSHFQIEPPLMASNGKEALTIMREIHPDLVFVDMSMPIMDGIDISTNITVPILRSLSLLINTFFPKNI